MLNKLKNLTGTVAIIAVSAFIFVMTLNFMMKVIIHRKKEVMIPDLTGKTIVQGVDFLSEYELYLKKVAEQFNED